jgi:hypothetical protein
MVLIKIDSVLSDVASMGRVLDGGGQGADSNGLHSAQDAQENSAQTRHG